MSSSMPLIGIGTVCACRATVTSRDAKHASRNVHSRHPSPYRSASWIRSSADHQRVSTALSDPLPTFRLAITACHSWPFLHIHQTFLPEFGVTSRGVNNLFFVGFHSRARGGLMTARSWWGDTFIKGVTPAFWLISPAYSHSI